MLIETEINDNFYHPIRII